MNKKLALIMGAAILLAPISCKQKEKVLADNSDAFSLYDLYPGTDLVDISPEESTAIVFVGLPADSTAVVSTDATSAPTSTDNTSASENKSTSKVSDKKTETASGSASVDNSTDSNAASANVPVSNGTIITDGEDIVGGFVSLDFSNIRTTPTGNVITDVKQVTDQVIPVVDSANGVMDIHITDVDELDDVVIKNGLANTHMVKGFVRMNGKNQDFEAPVNINRASEEFEITGDVNYDRSQFFDDAAFGHLTAEQLANDNIKVRVRLKSKGGKISVYDADTKTKEKIKFQDHANYVSEKIKEKGKGFKTKDKIIDRNERYVEKLKENNADGKNNAKIIETNQKTVEKLDRRKQGLLKHREALLVKQDRLKEEMKDKNNETQEKEKIKIDEQIGVIDAKVKDIDEYRNKIVAKGKSEDGGIENPNPAQEVPATTDSIN